jgi:protein-L-isoaspartate O-methyltransferase
VRRWNRPIVSVMLDNTLLIGGAAVLAHSAWRREHPVRAALLSAPYVLAHYHWVRTHPGPCPYGQRFWVQIPHLLITRARLREILAPQPGERILEVGPGTGYYSLHVAQWLTPDGVLDVFDIQSEMLNHTMRRASELRIPNIVPTQGDACALPYADNHFDAAYMNVTLGEIPDQIAALRELCRVLKPGGRLIVGELFVDPHMVTFGSLRARAEAAGLRFMRRLGGRLGYFASFRAPQCHQLQGSGSGRAY